MKKAQKRVWQLLTMVLALAVLCAPVSGFAESEGKLYNLTINGIVYTMDQGVLKQTIDLSDLDVNMKFGANEAGDRMLMGLGAGVKGDPAADVSLAVDKDQIAVGISGLDKLLTISMEELQSMMGGMMPGTEDLDSTGTGLVESLKGFTSEATEKELAESFSKLLSEGIDGITEAGTETIEIMGKSVEAQKVVYDMNTEQFMGFMEKTLQVLEENPAWNAYLEALRPLMDEDESAQLDAQSLIPLLRKTYTDVEFKGSQWVAGTDTSKVDLIISATLDANASLDDTVVAFKEYDDDKQTADADALETDETAADDAQPATSHEPYPLTLKVDVKSEVDGDLTNTNMQMTLQDEEQTGFEISFAMNADEKDSVEQSSFDMSMQMLDAKKKILTMQINGKSTDDEKSNNFEGEMGYADDAQELAIKLSYDGTKDSAGDQTTYEGTVNVQVDATSTIVPEDAGSMGLSFKTHLTEIDMPEGALIDSEGKEIVNFLTMTPEEQDMLILELQNVLLSGMGKLTQIPAIQALFGDAFSADAA